jgi:hypothetical protein
MPNPAVSGRTSIADCEERVAVRISKAILAGAAALLIAAAANGARAQTVGLRGSDSDQDELAPEPVPSSSSGTAAPALAPPLSPDAATPALGAAPDPSGMINYGKPKPKKPKLYQLYKPNPKTSPPLPPLVPYKTAPDLRRLAKPGAKNNPSPDPTLTDPDVQTQAQTPPSPTVAVLPALPQPKRPLVDPDPFAPTGVDVGSLRLFPFVETDIGYDTNPNSLSSQVKGSPYNYSEAGLRLQSNWSQNSLTADLHGGYADYFVYHQADHPDATGIITGRVDVTRDTQITSESRFNLATQQPGSPLLAIPGAVFITDRPTIVSYGETLGVAQNFNRLQLSLRGSFDRTVYQDAEQSDGSTLALSTENYNDYGVQGRVAYELSPSITPYVQIMGDLRRHDDYVDFSGFARDSNGIGGKGGAQFDIAGIFKGDLSAGYESRTYADPRLPGVAAPTIDGSLVYGFTPLTTITLKTGTNFSETTNTGTSGAVTHTASLQIAHAFTQQFTLTGTGTYQHDDYIGGTPHITDNFYTATLGAEYKLTRSIVLLASYKYARMIDSFPDSNYTDNVFMLGVRLQR